MKALTLWRPWPYAFFRLGRLNKDIENRTWAPPRWLLGQRVALHAGKKWDKEGAEFICDMVDDYADSIGKALNHRELLDKMRDAYPDNGAIIGTVLITGSYRLYQAKFDAFAEKENRWAFGPVCWRASDPVELTEPIPCRGAQGLWNVPEEYVERLKAA